MYGNKALTLSGGLYRPVDVCKKSYLNTPKSIFLPFPLSPLPPVLPASCAPCSTHLRQYWYQYIWFVNLDLTGMFLLGREAMRPRK
jgi:hypothetical protein